MIGDTRFISSRTWVLKLLDRSMGLTLLIMRKALGILERREGPARHVRADPIEERRIQTGQVLRAAQD